jgi:hypothetical protein
VGATHNGAVALGAVDRWPLVNGAIPTDTSRWAVPSVNTVDDRSDVRRTQHAHDEAEKRSLFCDVPDCKTTRKGKSFSRPFDLSRHKHEQHSPDCRRYICGCCRKTFVRKDKMLRHLRSAHAMSSDTSFRCSAAPCSLEGVNQEVHFISQVELDQHLAEAHKVLDAVTSESDSEPSKQ